MNFSRTRVNDDRGASLVEYGLIVAVISLLSLSAVTLVGEKTEETFTDVAGSLESAPGAGGPVGTVPPSGSDGGSGGGSGSTTTTTPPPATTTTTIPATTTTTLPPTTTTTVPATTTTQPQATPGSTTAPKAAASDFTWWNDTSQGGNGEWRASVTFENDWIRHQYLKLEVTETDDKGHETTTIVNSFYVPAGGSATFSHWGNDLKDHKGKITGVLQVEVKVLSITTSDQSWAPVTFPQDGSNVSVVEAPTVP